MASSASIMLEHLEATWSALNAQIANGSVNLAVPDNLPSTTVTELCKRYRELIDGPVVMENDAERRIIRFTPYMQLSSPATTPSNASVAPVASFESAAANVSKGKAKVPKGKANVPKGKATIPRPPNAFILFRKYHHEAVKAEKKGISNNEISKVIGKMWSDIGEAGKAEWKVRAIEAKEDHLKRHPGYSYQPRKPSEKKRRSTKRNMAQGDTQVDTPAAIVDPEILSVPQQALPDFMIDSNSPMHLEYGVDDHVNGATHSEFALDDYNMAFTHAEIDAANEPAAVSDGAEHFEQAIHGYDITLTVPAADEDVNAAIDMPTSNIVDIDFGSYGYLGFLIDPDMGIGFDGQQFGGYNPALDNGNTKKHMTEQQRQDELTAEMLNWPLWY